MEEKPVVYLRATDVPAEIEKKWNDWMDDIHVPLLMKFKGLKRATRYKKARKDNDYPQYLTIFEFDSMASFEEYQKSPELAAAAAEVKVSWPVRGTETRWQVQYEMLKSWGK